MIFAIYNIIEAVTVDRVDLTTYDYSPATVISLPPASGTRLKQDNAP